MFQQLIQEVTKMIQGLAGVRGPREVMGKFLDEGRSHGQLLLFLCRVDFFPMLIPDKKSVADS